MDLIETTPKFESLAERLRRSVAALWNCAKAFETCSGGVAASPEAGPGPLHVSLPHDCMRCGEQTTEPWNCADCERETAPMRARCAAKIPFCGTCGDTYEVPVQARIGYGPRDWDWQEIVCPDCPRCRECRVEWSRHRDGLECP